MSLNLLAKSICVPLKHYLACVEPTVKTIDNYDAGKPYIQYNQHLILAKNWL
jgi:hypothetical protein